MGFPIVSMLDPLTRAGSEEPISKGGEAGAVEEWRLPSWYKAGGGCSSSGWKAAAYVLGNEYGARWNPATYVNPAVRWQVFGLGGFIAARLLGLWACLQGTAQTGYRVTFTEATKAGNYTVTIHKVVAGALTLLATVENLTLEAEGYVGVTVFAGVVQVWAGPLEAMAIVAEAPDGTYTSGGVAFFADGNGPVFRNIEAGSITLTDGATKLRDAPATTAALTDSQLAGAAMSDQPATTSAVSDSARWQAKLADSPVNPT